MKLCTAWVAGALVALTVGVSATRAADVYWDINGTNAGATDDGGGVASAASGWGAADNFWSADPAGLAATGPWVAGNVAHFSAGTNATGTSVIGGNASIGGLAIEEGVVVISGTLTTTSGAAISVASGATLSTNSSARIAITVSSATFNPVIYTLNGTGAVLESTNPGGAGSFIDVDGQISLNGGGTLKYSGGGQLNILQPGTGLLLGQGVIGTGDLHIDAGSGALAIAGTCTYTGNTFIDGGELRIRTSANRLPVGTNVTVNSPGVMNLNGINQQIASLTGTGNVGLGAGTLTIDGSTSTTFDGALKNLASFSTGAFPAVTTGNGRLIKSGSSTITFNGQNDLSGSITLNAGGIIVSSGGSLCGPIADVVLNGGTLELNNPAQSVENFGGSVANTILNGTILTIDPATGATAVQTSYSGDISGTGGIKKQNTIAGGVTKTLTLSGNNSYSGGTEVAGGRLHANSATALGNSSGAVITNNNGVLAGNGTVANAITAQQDGHVGGGLGDGAGAVLTATGSVSILSGGHIDAVLGAAGSSSLTGDYNSNGVVDGADYVVWRNGGSPDSSQAGYDAWRGNFGATGGGSGIGTSDYLKSTLANGLSIAAGSVLTLTTAPGASPSGTYVALEYAGTHTGVLGTDMTINNATGFEIVSVVDNTTLKRFEVTIGTTPQTRSWTDSVINGNWSSVPAEAGNWTPAGQPNGPSSVGNFAGTNAHVVTITDSDKTLGTMTFNNAAGYTIAASGANRLVLDTYTGTPAINVNGGNHTISAPILLSKATTVTTAGGTTLSATNEITNAGNLVKAGAGTMIASGLVRSTGTVSVNAGTLELSGANTYSGATTILSGAILNANNVGTTSATGTSAVSNSGTLNVNGRITGTITTPAGGVTNISGTAATQTVSGGTVDVGLTGVLTGTATMSAGGTLQNGANFSANVQTASVVLNSAGHFAPGGIGTIGSIASSAAGTYAFNTGSVFDIDIGAAGFDQFFMGNTTANTVGLTIQAGATIDVNDIGGMTDGVYPIMTLGATPNAATIALAANWVFTGSTPGHTYTVGITGTTVNLTVTTPGSGSGLDGGAVPEPASIGLVAIALAAFAGRRNRRA